MAEQLVALGSLLKKAREDRSLTLDEVEVQTKIRAKFLDALEKGDLSDLPSNAHARGFLRNYAQFLYLDTESIVSQFNEAIGAETKAVTTLTAVTPPTNSAFTRDQFDSEPSQRRDRLATFVHPAQRRGPAAPRVSTPDEIKESRTPLLNRVRELLKAAVRNTGDETLEEERAAEPASQKEGAQFREIVRSPQFTIGMFVFTALVLVIWITISLSRLNVNEIVPTPQQSGVLESLGQHTGTPPTPTPTYQPTATPEADSGNVQVYNRVVLTINVETRAWTRITVDGEVLFTGQADPGMILQYEGLESIEVLTGNAAGLIITYNGQNLGPMGDREEVLERIFTVAGPVTPTPAPSPTATSTQVPTPTAGS